MWLRVRDQVSDLIYLHKYNIFPYIEILSSSQLYQMIYVIIFIRPQEFKIYVPNLSSRDASTILRYISLLVDIYNLINRSLWHLV